MNIAEFNTELGKLIARGINEGVHANKLGVDNLVGVLELQKADLIRYVQDQARLAQMQQQQKNPGITLPGDLRFKMPPLNGGGK